MSEKFCTIEILLEQYFVFYLKMDLYQLWHAKQPVTVCNERVWESMVEAKSLQLREESDFKGFGFILILVSNALVIEISVW